MQIHIDNGFAINDERHKQNCVTCRAIAKKGVQHDEHVKDLFHAQQDSLWSATHDEDKIKTTALCMRCYAPIPFEHQLCEECHKIVNIR